MRGELMESDLNPYPVPKFAQPFNLAVECFYLYWPIDANIPPAKQPQPVFLDMAR